MINSDIYVNELQHTSITNENSGGVVVRVKFKMPASGRMGP